MGHASCSSKAVDPDYERLGELSVTLDDIKRFRQLDSKCPGARWTSGIETTTGPLGQVVATSVGMGKAVSRRRQT
jgi:transketolase